MLNIVARRYNDLSSWAPAFAGVDEMSRRALPSEAECHYAALNVSASPFMQ